MSPAALGFLEAIEYAEKRQVILPQIYYSTLLGIQRGQAVSIAGLASLEQIKFIIDLVTEALRDGLTFVDFKERVRDGGVDVALPAHRLDNIFRTNMQVAYNRGRWQQQKLVAHSRPYLMYDSINDSRTRPSHLAMDGTILSRDDPWWNSHYPPCGYRCRCTVISLTPKQAAKRGISPLAPDVDPDEGWDFNPGDDYTSGVREGLASFGDDLEGDHPRLKKAVYDAKKRITEESNTARGNTSLPAA